MSNNNINLEQIRFPKDFRPIFEFPPPVSKNNSQTQSQISKNKNEIYVAIPCGKKAHLWFSNDGNENGCFLINHQALKLSKPLITSDPKRDQHENEIQKISIGYCVEDSTYFHGTLISGTLVYPPNSRQQGENEYFVADDLLYHKGLSLTKFSFCERLEYLVSFMKKNTASHPVSNQYDLDGKQIKQKKCNLVLAYMRGKNEKTVTPRYVVHHWQSRVFDECQPYQYLRAEPQTPPPTQPQTQNRPPPPTQPQTQNHRSSSSIYNEKVIFKVVPENNWDVYSLYATDENQREVLYGNAGIFSYETSQMLNHHFTKKFPKTLDEIEESDDDEERETKTETKIKTKTETRTEIENLFECVFSAKFRKWVPISPTTTNKKPVSIHLLNPNNTMTTKTQTSNQHPRHKSHARI
jgi:hypothetical protein